MAWGATKWKEGGKSSVPLLQRGCGKGLAILNGGTKSVDKLLTQDTQALDILKGDSMSSHSFKGGHEQITLS